MPYLNTSSGLTPTVTGYPTGQQPQATPMPTAQPQGPQNIGTVAGGLLGHLLSSAFSPGQPMQLTGANPQTAPQPMLQGGVLSRLLAGFAQPQQGQAASGQQQGPIGGTRFVNGLNVVG